SISGSPPVEALPIIKQLASDPSTLSSAIDLLGHGGREAAAILADLIATSKDQQGPYYAGMALAKMPADAKLPQLQKISTAAASNDLQRAEPAANVLITMRPQANEVLASLLGKGPAQIRVAVLKGLDTPDAAQIDLICANLSYADVNVRS